MHNRRAITPLCDALVLCITKFALDIYVVFCLDRFYRDGLCRFGDQCTQAHSDEELEEWRKRFEYRRQRLVKAKDSEMLQGSSFAEQLLERWMSAQNPELIVSLECRLSTSGSIYTMNLPSGDLVEIIHL